MTKIEPERDYNLWLKSQAIAIENRDLDAIDWDNLLEEIVDMEASQKRALRSYFYRLVERILKLRDWHLRKEENKLKWRVEITSFRREIDDILSDSPSLKNYLHQNHITWFNKVIDNYQKNKLFAVTDKSTIPLSKIMDDDYFPG